MTDRYPKNWSRYDLCLKCPFNRKFHDISAELVLFINKLSKIVGPQYIYGFISKHDGLFTILIRAGSKFVHDKAIKEKEKWQFLLDSEMTKLIATKGNPDHFINPFTIAHDTSVSSISPFSYIYSSFSDDRLLSPLYDHHGSSSASAFNKTIRIKMLLDLLQNNADLLSEEGGTLENDLERGEENRSDKGLLPSSSSLGNGINYSLSNLLHNRIILNVYAVHDFSELSAIKNRVFAVKWTSFFFTKIPSDLIKDYFGEKIALDLVFFGEIPASPLSPFVSHPLSVLFLSSFSSFSLLSLLSLLFRSSFPFV
jgi:hypothetical protein